MANENVIQFTDANFDQEVLNSDVPVLVDFSTEWCPPCRRLAPMIDKLATDYSGRVKVGKLDTDSNLATAGKYRINTIPRVLMFKGGQLTQELRGLPRSEKDLRDKVEALLL